MRHWMLLLLAWSFLLLGAQAQSEGELTAAQQAQYTKDFQDAMAAHQAGRYSDAIAGFAKCLELRPKEPTAAYNLACGNALLKEVDTAFEWLGRAVEWGFGASVLDTDTIVLAESGDSDLELLRPDPRFAPLIAKMKASAKAVEDYANSPLFYVPEALAKAEEVGLLVVLHERGSTKEALQNSTWKSLADELGLALALPSGRIPMSADPAEGMQWFASIDLYSKAAWKYERNVNAAVEAFKKQHKLDKQRVFLAGEGQGGMLAFNVAIGAPGLYKGVLVFDAPLLLTIAQSKAANAIKMGFRGRLFASTQSMFGLPAGGEIQKLVEALVKGTNALGLSGFLISTYAPEPALAEQRRKLALAALREWIAAPALTEGSTK